MGRGRHRRATPTDVVRVHRDHRAWLEAELVKPFLGQTIVVPHHAPQRACLAEDAQVPTAYASDLFMLIATHKPDQRLFGHTHHPGAFQQGQALVRNVSLGYPGDVIPEYEAGLLASGNEDFTEIGTKGGGVDVARVLC